MPFFKEIATTQEELVSTSAQNSISNAQQNYLSGQDSFLQKNKFIIFGALAVVTFFLAYNRNKTLRKWQI